ncbi:MAG: tRNA (adenosine(37)-N6)-threonylcarbamoyltransferase complex dimerization subunit type 1 TsaB [Bacteroidetes bacterium]|nr:tRNA (adenosine(37)-N6)-threonylcarbamoyltransferase complex dimerization subunit type 1 TsaB [Bacteroidota bacterium]
MNKPFPILAVETSGDLCSAAVMMDEKSFSEINILKKHIHSEKLLLMIKQVLGSVDLSVNDIAQIAFSNGPGSFTGLRIGLSAVKGIAFGVDIPVIPVPTFDALAYKISLSVNNDTNFGVVSNVNTEELYFSAYKKVNDQNLELLKELSLIKKDEFEISTKNLDSVFGNFSHKKVFNKSTFPTAINIAEWAYLFGQELLTYNFDYLEPNYFKKFAAKVNK